MQTDDGRILIRNETPDDFKAVESLTRSAFWNVNAPGCDEHCLVHTMRSHRDFIPELDFVLFYEGRLAANVMYARSRLVDEAGNEKTVLTFGPLSVLPELQRQGLSKLLLEHSFEKARSLGYDTIVIFGNPENYIARGFQSCKKLGVSLDGGVFPTALLVKELTSGALGGKAYTYRESDAFEVDPKEAEEFDGTFPPLEKAYRKSQELFYIYSHSCVVR